MAETTFVDLIRHGEPEGGPRFRGRRDDALSARGFEQMRAALPAGEMPDRILSSPLRRCRDFAEELARLSDRPLTIEPDFCEISFGDWEGHTLEEVQQSDGERLAAFWRDAEQHPPPNGEALAAFHERVARAWDYWSAELRDERVLVVGHGGVIRMILARVLEIAPAKAMARLQVPYACRTRLRLDNSEHGRLVALVEHGVRP